MDRDIGLDAHASSCTVATMGPSGRRIASQVVETDAGAPGFPSQKPPLPNLPSQRRRT